MTMAPSGSNLFSVKQTDHNITHRPTINNCIVSFSNIHALDTNTVHDVHNFITLAPSGEPVGVLKKNFS